MRDEGEWICLTDRKSGTVIWIGVDLDWGYADLPRIKVAIDAPPNVHIRRGELEPNAERTER